MTSGENGIEPWNFSWVVNGMLSACSWPRTDREIIWLRRQGIKAIISLSEERQPPPSAWSDMDCHVIAVEEFEPPTMEQIIKFNDICDKMTAENKPVCVHCRMGLGRTGVMLACYFVKHYNQTALEAIRNIRLMRPWSIETRSQEKAVKNFEKYIK
ncbi:dual specificity protein phosphatase 23-like [Macrobrachium rosenbergii]|uniref:dual specificity protein phosphatase 23-like n=1 Tax=Macrobrachium rosenbergii TaxID=79674 RepID=UPI0034D3FEEA